MDDNTNINYSVRNWVNNLPYSFYYGNCPSRDKLYKETKNFPTYENAMKLNEYLCNDDKYFNSFNI